VSAADVPEQSHVYPRSDESMAPYRAVGRAAGLLQLGIRLVRVPPGHRTSWPHAEEKEEEFAYVIEGEIDAWNDGELHRMRAGDLIAWPSGTGISHTMINNGSEDALLLAGGHTYVTGSRIYYPFHDGRKEDMPWSHWWHDVPKRALGKHDGMPDALRARVNGAKNGAKGAAKAAKTVKPAKSRRRDS
jgi:uncharacterized cupin superfamily protein